MSEEIIDIQDQLNEVKELDPWEWPPPLEQVGEGKRAYLKEQALLFHTLWQSFKAQPFFSSDNYYLISTRLQRWRQYVGYEEVIANSPSPKFLGCGRLPQINSDLIKDTSFGLHFQDSEWSHLNTQLKEGLMEGRDYEFLSQQIWKFFNGYERQQVKRYVVKTDDGKKVELYFQLINLVALHMSYLKEIEQERIRKLQALTFQFSRYQPISQFIEAIRDIIVKKAKQLDRWANFRNPVPIRVWRLKEDTQLPVLLNLLQQGCKANPSFSYKLFLEGDLMKEDSYLSEYDLLKSSYLMAQVQEDKQTWCFFNLKYNLEASCNYCKMIAVLNVVCSCKAAVYCSRQCKISDKTHHRIRCPNDAESEEDEKELVLQPQSRRGLTGLRNLGNTCFMNSGLQCLSHIDQLSEYFLQDTYLNDINRQNPLGTKGQLSEQYAKLIKNLWFGLEPSFTPLQLKKSIGKFQPMFSGYNQHDSGQLITYLLDGLHEDLNRVKQKPYTQTHDSNGRPDQIVAQESWQTFLKRNRSIIVDLMYGQFKSIVNCPNEDCRYESITFDPFSVCQLPIVNNNMKELELIYIKDHIYTKKIFYPYNADSKKKMIEAMVELKVTVGLPPQSRLNLFVASYSSCEMVDLDSSVDYIRREYKYRTLFLRQLLPHQNPDKDIRVTLANVVNHSYYSDESYRKNIIPYRLYFINPELTNKQVYLILIGYYAKILKWNLIQQEFERDYLGCEEKDDIFRLLMIPTSRYYTCDYCKKKKCDGCKLPYVDRLFRDYIKWSSEKDQDIDKKIDMELFWRKNDKEIQKIFQEIKDENESNFQKINTKTGINISDCIKLFQRVETLAEDNAWYCPRCKDFVLANKQMKIYKAPKILVFCLKRFKRKDYYSQKFNILVDFPVEGLDMSEFVLNRDLPQDYPKGEQKMEIEGGLIYDLIGVSNHFGSTGGGHYTAFCKDSTSGDWYDFDDSSVTRLRDKSDVVSQNAYILFFRRR